jgi:hypothetical protein
MTRRELVIIALAILLALVVYVAPIPRPRLTSRDKYIEFQFCEVVIAPRRFPLAPPLAADPAQLGEPTIEVWP